MRLMHDHVGAVVGEVEQAVAGALHQGRALAGDPLGGDLADGGRVGLVLDEALVRDHRAGAGEEVLAGLHGDLEHRARRGSPSGR